MRRAALLYLLLCGCLIASWQSLAQMPMTGAGVPLKSASVGYSGPGDVVSGATAWWGLRAYSAAKRGTKAVNVCTPSDTTCADFSTDATTGNLVITTIGGSDCTVVQCLVKTFYDQTGNGNDITNASSSTQANFTVSCVNSLPCVAFVQGSGNLYSFSITRSQPFTISVVSEWTTNNGGRNEFVRNTGSSNLLGYIANAGCGGGVSCLLMDTPGGVQFSSQALISVWHAFQGAWNSSSSFAYVDGTNATGGSIDTTGLSPTEDVSASGGFTGNIAEIGIWPSAFSGGQSSSMNSNQHTYWGF